MPGIMCEKNELQKAWMSFLYSLFELSCYDSLLYPLGAISDMEMQEHYDEFFEVNHITLLLVHCLSPKGKKT